MKLELLMDTSSASATLGTFPKGKARSVANISFNIGEIINFRLYHATRSGSFLAFPLWKVKYATKPP